MEDFGFVESSFGVLGMLLTLLPVFVFLVIVAGIVIATVWITKYLKRQEADRKRCSISCAGRFPESKIRE